MGFKGDLQNIGLSDVLQNIASNRLAGTLRISTGKEDRYVYFTDGGISMVSHGKIRKPMTDVLRKEGRISEADHTQIVKRQAKSPRHLPDLLGEMDIMKPEEYQASVRSHVEEEVYEVFGWRSAHFEFTEGDPPKEIFDSDQRAASLSLQPTSLMMEAMRRLDEWEKIRRRIPSMMEILAPTSPALPQGDVPGGDAGREVLQAVNGRKTLQAVVDGLPFSKFRVCKAAYDLIEAGLLRSLTEYERVRLAESLVSTGHHAEALEIYRFSLELDRKDHDIRRKQAALLETMGKKEEASAEVKILGHMLAEEGNREGAIGAYQWAVGLSPGDTVAWEKLYTLRKEAGGEAEIIRIGRDLAQLYRKVGLAEKARDLYLELLGIRHRDVDLEELLAKTYLDLGETRSAANRYRSAARLHLEDRNYDEAAEIYEQILKIDPENPEAQKIVVQIREGKIALRKERFRKGATFILIAAVSIIILGALIYESISRKAFHSAHMYEIDYLRTGDIRGAMDLYEAMAERYPYSLASLEARAAYGRLAIWAIDDARSSDDAWEMADEEDLPSGTRERALRRYFDLHLREQIGEYEKAGDEERTQREQSVFGTIKDSRAARAILDVHREIRDREWAYRVNDALLTSMNKMTDPGEVVEPLIQWMEELPRDYPDLSPTAAEDLRKRDLTKIVKILLKLTGDPSDFNDETVRVSSYWRNRS